MAERWGQRRTDAWDVLTYGAAGIALYYIWKYFRKADEGVDLIGDWIARPIAYVISKITLPPQFHVPGGVVFKDGGYVSWDAIIDGGSKLSSNNTFVWQGRLYRVLKRREDGNYAAEPV